MPRAGVRATLKAFNLSRNDDYMTNNYYVNSTKQDDLMHVTMLVRDPPFPPAGDVSAQARTTTFKIMSWRTA